MLIRRKLCVAALITAILFLMLASQGIQRRHFLSLATPPSRDTSLRGGGGNVDAVFDLLAPSFELIPGPTKTRHRLNTTRTSEKLKAVEEAGPLEEEVEPVVEREEPRSCGCSGSCISDMEGSDWFSQRYDPKQQPVLRQKNNSLDPDDLKWWLGLQRSGNDRTLVDVTSELFQVISPPTGDFRPLPSVCRKCAVVGNSGNLRQSGHGQLIDSHDFVIRMNKAVTRGFEKDVGNRTTHHLLYPESAIDMGDGVSLVLLPFKLRDLEWLTSALSTGEVKMTYMRVKDRIQADKDKVLVVNPGFFKYVHEHWTERHGRYPSTGMLAIVFALHICDQVSVFGYGADQQGNWHHYWEENRHAGAFRKTGVHSADFESQVIQHLNEENKISLYRLPLTSDL